MPRHDLKAYLGEVAARLETFPDGVVISWADDTQLGDANFEHWATCTTPTRKRPVWVIGVSKALRRAPRYVLRWLVLHEALHIKLPACAATGVCHHYYFRQAERAHPDFLRANAWLNAHTDLAAQPGFHWLDAHVNAATKAASVKSKA